jgi:molybdate/tungstate transport system substrate-binding protein
LSKDGNIPWYKVISEKGFKLGRTDPELDPKGYNAIIVAKLSNIYYKDMGLKQRILGEDRISSKYFLTKF